jgi:hypothetical protein
MNTSCGHDATLQHQEERRPLLRSPFAVSRTDLNSVCVIVDFFFVSLMDMVVRTVVS